MKPTSGSPPESTGTHLDRGEAARRMEARAKRGPAREYCPHCDARMERGDDGHCNRCGEEWPEEKTARGRHRG